MCKTELPDDAAYFHAAYRQAIPVENGTEFTIIDGIRGNGWLAGVSHGLRPAQTATADGSREK